MDPTVFKQNRKRDDSYFISSSGDADDSEIIIMFGLSSFINKAVAVGSSVFQQTRVSTHVSNFIAE